MDESKLLKSWACQTIASPVFFAISLCISFIIVCCMIALANFLFEASGTGIYFAQLQVYIANRPYGSLNIKTHLKEINILIAVCTREWLLVNLLLAHNPGEDYSFKSSKSKRKKKQQRKRNRPRRSYSLAQGVLDNLVSAQACILQFAYPIACKFVRFAVKKYCPSVEYNKKKRDEVVDVDYDVYIDRKHQRLKKNRSNKLRPPRRQNDSKLDRVRKWAENSQFYAKVDGYDACPSSDEIESDEDDLFAFHEIPRQSKARWNENGGNNRKPDHQMIPLRDCGDINGIQRAYPPPPPPPMYDQYLTQSYRSKPHSSFDEVMSNLSANTMSLINDEIPSERPSLLQGSRSSTIPNIRERSPSASTIRVGTIRAPTSTCNLSQSPPQRRRRRRLYADQEIISKENETLGALKYHLRKR